MSHPPDLLLLVHRVPFPPDRGDRIRSYEFLKYLAQRYRVHLATLVDEPTGSAVHSELAGLCHRVALESVAGSTRWLRGLRALLSGKTMTEGLFCSRRLTRTLQGWAADTRYSAAVVYCSSMIQYIQQQPAWRDLPLLVDLVDVDSQKFLDYAAAAPPGVKRLLYRLEGRRLRRLESTIPDRAQAITLVSENEADVYRGFCPNDITHGVPNGVDLEFFAPDRGHHRSIDTACVFVGALDYHPNIEGLHWFCKHVWPSVVRQKARARFQIVGRRPDRRVTRLARQPGIEVVGQVPDVRPYLRDAAVAVVPLSIARGIQNKVLEAMAMGKPVIATSQALEGLGASSQHVIRADSAQQWATELLRLFDDRALRHELGESGRRFVERHHSWPACLRPLGELLGWAANREQLDDYPNTSVV